MVTTDITRRILNAIASAMPEDGQRNLVTRVDVRRGWGNAIYVELYSGMDPATDAIDRTVERRFMSAVDEALGTERHQVHMHWNYHWRGQTS